MDKQQMKHHLSTLFPAELKNDEWIELDWTPINQPKNYCHFGFFKTIDDVIDHIFSLEKPELRSFAIHTTLKKSEYKPEDKKVDISRVFQVVIDIDNYQDYNELIELLKGSGLYENLSLVIKTGGGLQVLFNSGEIEGEEKIKSVYETIVRFLSKYIEVDKTSINLRKGQRLAGTHNIKYDGNPLVEIVHIGTGLPLDVKPILLKDKIDQFIERKKNKETNLIKEIKSSFTFFDLFPELEDNIVRKSSNHIDILCPIHPERNPSASIYTTSEGYEVLVDFHPNGHKGIEYPSFLAVKDGIAIFDVIDLYAFKHGLTLKEAIGELSERLNEKKKENIDNLFRSPDFTIYYYYDKKTGNMVTLNKENAKIILKAEYGIKKDIDDVLYNLETIEITSNPKIPFGLNNINDYDYPVFNTFKKPEVMKEFEKTSHTIDINQVDFNIFTDDMVREYFKNITGNNVEYLRTIVAFLVAKLDGNKIGVAPILSTPTGTGKSSVLYGLFTKLFGKKYIGKFKQAYLFGSFNSELENKYVVFLEEMYVSEKAKHYEEFKELITETRIIINKKNVPEYQTDIFVDFFGFTNNPSAVRIEDKDDRRFILMRVDKDKAKDLKYISFSFGYKNVGEFIDILIDKIVEWVYDYALQIDPISALLWLSEYARIQNETIKKEIAIEQNPFLLIAEKYDEIEDYIMLSPKEAVVYKDVIEGVKSGKPTPSQVRDILILMGVKVNPRIIKRKFEEIGIKQKRDIRRYYDFEEYRKLHQKAKEHYSELLE